MKDILLPKDDAETRTRTEAFSRHLDGMDWQKIRGVMTRYDYSWRGLVSTVMGIKPAFVFSDDELEAFNPMDFVPDSLKENFVLEIKRHEGTFQGWLVDYKQIAKVFNKYSQHFPDFDFKYISNKDYIRKYIHTMTTIVDENGNHAEVIKTGLSLGYPYNSVVNFQADHTTKPFDVNGYEFGSTKTDRTLFKTWLLAEYDKSGMDGVLERNKTRIKKEFGDSLKTVANTIEVVKVKEKKYLEVKFVDLKSSRFGVQFVPVVLDRLSGVETTNLLNAFAVRHNLNYLRFVPPKMGKLGSVGVGYEGCYESLFKSSRKNIIPYLTLDEYATEIKTGVMVVARSKIFSLLKANGKKKEALLFSVN